MQETAWQAFSERMSCEDRWHVDCVAIDWPLSSARAAELAERALSVLTSVAALEDRRVENSDDENPLLPEIQRLEAKLTALVYMVSQLLESTGALPARQRLRFNAIGAVLPAASVPPDKGLLLRLHFDACPNLPLELAARVERKLEDGRVFVVFALPNEALGEAIERLIFRHHRRQIAEKRHLTN
ncbi:MAG: PilZ domain-containing protein [Rhodanobacter sp.]|nr:MAG: PilZ domain-containing protein [Rhodanobacter sp.]